MGCHVGRQEVSSCGTRPEFQGMYITLFLNQVQIRLLTLALKPRGDVTRSPKQWYQWPNKRTCVHQKCKKSFEQECILVGCVPSATVAVCWGMPAPGGACSGRCLLSGGVCSRGVSAPRAWDACSQGVPAPG